MLQFMKDFTFFTYLCNQWNFTPAQKKKSHQEEFDAPVSETYTSSASAVIDKIINMFLSETVRRTVTLKKNNITAQNGELDDSKHGTPHKHLIKSVLLDNL